MPDIKDLLDGVIKDTDNSYNDKTQPRNDSVSHDKFDKVSLRDKISMFVLKDIICAMMHDDTKDLDGMIDTAIMNHINTNYGGSCYNYLTTACKDLQSPLIADIVMEINDTCDKAEQEACLTKDGETCFNEACNKTKELLKQCDNYDEFRNKVKKLVSDKIVDDITTVIVNGNDVTTADHIDEEMDKQTKKDKQEDDAEAKEAETKESETKTESVIMKLCEAIVTESYIEKHETMSTDEGLTRAIIEYCIVQMDGLFKQNRNYDAFSKYIK
jgi:hypothetical protein